MNVDLLFAHQMTGQEFIVLKFVINAEGYLTGNTFIYIYICVY